jgi:MFS transporter, PAT family, beta-lactamase induction signal transducer AmpG
MTSQARVAAGPLALFASIYAVQGIVVAYFFNFNKAYMTGAGVDETLVGGVESLVLLPFVFKFLVGPLSDRVNLLGWGNRKPYILLGIALQTVGLIGLAGVDPGRHLWLFGALAFLAIVGLALYDTCCDGMVVDVTPPGDRARVQGLLMLSRFLATMVCTLGFGLWLDRSGPGPAGVRGVLWACVALGLIPLALAIPVPDPRRADDAEVFQWSALRALIRPRAIVLLIFGAIYSLVAVGGEINLSSYYGSLGFSQGDVGVFGATRYGGRAVGALLLPLAASRLGRRTILTLGVLGLVLSTAGQAIVGGRPSAGALAFFFGVANGWDDALFCVLAMEASDPRMAASTYALFMAVSNLSVGGDWLFASAVHALDGNYAGTYLLAALVTLTTLFLIPVLGRPAPRQEFDDGPSR